MDFKLSFKKILFFTFIVFLLVFIVILKTNLFSGEKIFLEILGPSEVEFGKEVEYLVKIKNNSKFRIERPELFFDPPQNAFINDKPAERQVVSKEVLGEFIYPGEEKTVSFKMKFFGEPLQKKEMKATLFYTPKNIKSRFKRETSFTCLILAPPINFTLDCPTKVSPQKEFDIYITYYSNSETPLTNLFVKVDFPPNFEILNTQPKPEKEGLWPLGALNWREGGKIKIVGRFLSESKEGKLFSAKLGFFDQEKFLVLKRAEKGVEVSAPSIFVRQEVQGLPEYVAQPGELLHYKVYFKNVGNEGIPNLILVSKLEGDGFDFSSVKSENGTWQTSEHSLVFDSKSLPCLGYLMPLEECSFDFWVRVRDDIENVSDLNLKNTVFLGPAKNEFSIKVAPKFHFFAKAVYEDQIFGNAGPLPPKVGEKTSYTILWTVKTYQLGCLNGKVSAKLGENVNFTGKIHPAEETSNFLFDSENKEILWQVNNLEKQSEKTLAFQIEFLPQKEQKGKEVELVVDQKFECFEQLSQKEISVEAPPITTAFSPHLEKKKAIVQ